MDILQAGVALLANHDPGSEQPDQGGGGTNGGAVDRQVSGAAGGLGPDPAGPGTGRASRDLDHAANFLYMLTGERPAEDTAQFYGCGAGAACGTLLQRFDVYGAPGGLHPGAHVRVGSAAVGSLSGELHGGANVRVMQMLQKIGSVDKVEEFVKAQLDAGKSSSDWGMPSTRLTIRGQ